MFEDISHGAKDTGRAAVSPVVESKNGHLLIVWELIEQYHFCVSLVVNLIIIHEVSKSHLKSNFSTLNMVCCTKKVPPTSKSAKIDSPVFVEHLFT